MSTKNDKTVLETIFNPFLSGDCLDEDDNQESSDRKWITENYLAQT